MTTETTINAFDEVREKLQRMIEWKQQHLLNQFVNLDVTKARRLLEEPTDSLTMAYQIEEAERVLSFDTPRKVMLYIARQVEHRAAGGSYSCGLNRDSNEYARKSAQQDVFKMLRPMIDTLDDAEKAWFANQFIEGYLFTM